MRDQTAIEPEVIIPNLHWNYSGVTATNRMVAPRMAGLVRVGWLGPDRPEGVAPFTAGQLLRLRFRAREQHPAPIWHARRNNEMIVGVLLKRLGWPIRLVFTYAGGGRQTWITRFLVRNMEAVIATGEKAASLLDRKSVVIHHGVDTALYCPPADRAAAFAAAGLPGRRAIGCFGRLRPQKGTDVFVEAMCRLLPRYPDFTAIVIGAVSKDNESFVGQLKAQSAAAGISGRLRFLGERPVAEMPLWFQRISIYAFTSRREGFGLTLIEAMAAGTALVAARSGAADVVVAPGETGILVPPGDAEALTAALEPLMKEPERAEEFGRRARARAAQVHGISAEAEAIVAVYREVWSRPPC
jgi:mannosyltransferase